jgi:release factor glutamine methyltransferase
MIGFVLFYFLPMVASFGLSLFEFNPAVPDEAVFIGFDNWYRALVVDQEVRLSGAVALAIASERPLARVVSTDISQAALEIARRNADELGMAERIRLVSGDGFAAVAGETFDLIVSNPPYVAESQRGRLPPELVHEPEVALFAGKDGLRVLRELTRGAGSALSPGGGFAVELAPEQAPTVAGWCRDAGLLEVRTLRDLAARPRVVVARMPSS